MSELASGPAIQSGTAVGMLQFADWVVDKGYGTSAAWAPLKSAVRTVFSTVEGGDTYEEIDVRKLDESDYLHRYEVKARGHLKAESIASYRSRFGRALEAYRHFLDTGQPPRQGRRQTVSRASDGQTSPSDTKARVEQIGPRPGAKSTTGVEQLIDYPFPLRSGQIAMLRLPLRLDRSDAERLAAYIRALVFEQQREPSAPAPGGDSDS